MSYGDHLVLREQSRRLAAAAGSYVSKRVMTVLIRRGGWPLPVRLLERLRTFASYALGAGSANLPVGESGETKLLEHFAHLWRRRDTITVVDVGANRGAYTEAVRAAFGGRAWIDCFEPDPGSFEALERQIAGDVQIRCHRLALGAAPGTARLYTNRSGSPLASLLAESFEVADVSAAGSEEVQVETLDRIAERFGLEQIDLLKIDVEGHELAVLGGARELLKRGVIAVVQFEFGMRNLASRTYLRDFVTLLGADYELYRIGPRGLSRLEYDPGREMFLEETNYAAVRRDANG